MINAIDTPIGKLSGVGKAREEQLNRLGIRTVRDLLYHFPRSYENRSDVAELGDFDTENSRSYILTVASEVKSAKLKNRLTISRFRAFDDTGSCEIVFFNSPFVKDLFHIGDVYRFYGKSHFSKGRILTLTSPKYERVVSGAPLADYLPVYPLTEGLSSKILGKLIEKAVYDFLPFMNDPLTEEIRLFYALPSLNQALKNVHFPDDANALERAKARLAFDEIFYFALGISHFAKKRDTTPGVTFKPTSLLPFTEKLPYELTGAQKRVINDIYRDTVLKKADGHTPSMARIIVGDVGSGKTVCAAAAIYLASISGYQSALMAPTEILATQHYNDLTPLFSALGIKVELLTGSLTKAKKTEIYERISKHEVDLVVGTHALISEKFDFPALGLIITDEQHRFGVRQRAILKDKTKSAHMLVMSATPIPRTLALAMYGDLDVSRIDEMPKGRMKVETYLVGEEYRSRINSFIEKQTKLGGQCYIVCPSIESNEADETYLTYQEAGLKNTVEYTEELKKALPSLSIASLNGKMKADEKDKIMSDFAEGKIQVLVSTTVIEVGVNVPNATLMIIENAERFGLSQLHQLRGRVGRGQKKSYCILVSDAEGEKAKSRLEVIRSSYDGYEIAEKDLVLRGPGDFFSSQSDVNLRQSGGFSFNIAQSYEDTGIFDKAFSAAKSVIEKDPELSLAEHSEIKSALGVIIGSISTIS